LTKVLLQEKRELHELLSYHNSRVGDCEEFDDSDLDEDWEEISFLEKKLANASEFVKGKAVRTWQCKNSTTSMPQTLMRYPL